MVCLQGSVINASGSLVVQFQARSEPSAVKNILGTKEVHIQRIKTLEHIRVCSQSNSRFSASKKAAILK